MIFLRYRYTWSHGFGEYRLMEIDQSIVDDEPAFDDLILNLDAECDYSEHYRGLDYEVVGINGLTEEELRKLIYEGETYIDQYKKEIKFITNNVKKFRKRLKALDK